MVEYTPFGKPIELIKCKKCHSRHKQNAILKHLSHKKSCMKSYSEEEIDLMKSMAKKNHILRTKAWKQKRTSKKVEDSKSSTKDKKDGIFARVACKNCGSYHWQNTILKHLRMKPDCKIRYSQEDIQNLRILSKINNKKVDSVYRQRTKNMKKLINAKNYATNQQKIRKKQAKYYSKKSKKIRECRKENYMQNVKEFKTMKEIQHWQYKVEDNARSFNADERQSFKEHYTKMIESELKKFELVDPSLLKSARVLKHKFLNVQRRIDVAHQKIEEEIDERMKQIKEIDYVPTLKAKNDSFIDFVYDKWGVVDDTVFAIIEKLSKQIDKYVTKESENKSRSIRVSV